MKQLDKGQLATRTAMTGVHGNVPSMHGCQFVTSHALQAPAMRLQSAASGRLLRTRLMDVCRVVLRREAAMLRPVGAGCAPVFVDVGVHLVQAVYHRLREPRGHHVLLGEHVIPARCVGLMPADDLTVAQQDRAPAAHLTS